MKKQRIALSIKIACLFIIVCVHSLSIIAAEESLSISDVREQIDRVVSEEVNKAKIPNAAIAIICGDEVEYLSYSDTGGEPAVDMHTLFQIGSLSKAFTGLGILLLEDKGLLSLDDPVSKHISWFTVSYEGKTVPPDDFTIANLLYQTSGFSNSYGRYPAASYGVPMEEGVKQIIGSELAFYPSNRYAYANANYRILGLIIEEVSGQSYDSFMTEHILLPLGLNSTYTAPQNALNTGNVIGGHRAVSFLRAWTYDLPAAEGNVPSGYIYSNTRDMSRWLQIQMGSIDVSVQFQRIIEKSHQPNPGSAAYGNMLYAAGWSVDSKTGEIMHSGVTENYSSFTLIRPQRHMAVCVFTNISNTSNSGRIADNILNLLEGKSVETYRADLWSVFDVVFSIAIILSVICMAVCVFIVVKMKRQVRDGRRGKVKLTRKSLDRVDNSQVKTLTHIAIQRI